MKAPLGMCLTVWLFRRGAGKFLGIVNRDASHGIKMSMSIFRSQQVPTWGLSVFCDFCGFPDSFAVKPKRGGGLREFIEKIFGLALKYVGEV